MQRLHLPTVDSTNEAAKRLLHERRISRGAVITADEQTSGKGTRGRRWVSLRGAGIYLSIVEVPTARLRPPPTTLFTQSAAVACVEALRDSTGVKVRIKPINDLYVGGRKLGGILVETMVSGGVVEALITGIGINVRETARPLDGRGIEPTSLQAHLGAAQFRAFQAEALIQSLVQRVMECHYGVMRGEADDIQERFMAHQADAPV